MSDERDKVYLEPQFKRLSNKVWVGPQVSFDDLSRAALQGIGTIICNRPDGEDFDQPLAEQIAASAEAAGMDFLSIPVTHAGIGPGEIDAMAAALTRDDEVALAYCRSGTRSTLLWALARASLDDDPDDLAAAAAHAGYDVRPVRAAMDELSERRK